MVTQLMDPPIAFIEKELPGQLRQEFRELKALFHTQPVNVQRMLELQAHLLAKAIDECVSPVHFILPNQVICELTGSDRGKILSVPVEVREQKVGGIMDLLKGADLYQRLAELEASSNPSIATSASLLRFAIAIHMVHRMLPTGHPTDDEESQDGDISSYARRFFLPQWVAFDDQDNLLVNSIQEAEAHIASMQRYMGLLNAAVNLAPYIAADDDYQQKRSGMFGQLVNQGRALARFKMSEMICIVQKRVVSGNLNRGLGLSLPYFDDLALELKFRDFQVIPVGRVLFVPAFVVIASRMEQIKVEHDPELSSPTRRHLLEELKSLELAFEHNHGGNSC